MRAKRKRQLLLPGLRRPPAQSDKRAKRDYSAYEFARALVRNGFMPLAGGLLYKDTTRQIGGVFHGVRRTDPVRIARRKTLAKLIRDRENAVRTACQNRVRIAEEKC